MLLLMLLNYSGFPPGRLSHYGLFNDFNLDLVGHAAAKGKPVFPLPDEQGAVPLIGKDFHLITYTQGHGG
jgi:hypothetical protein